MCHVVDYVVANREFSADKVLTLIVLLLMLAKSL